MDRDERLALKGACVQAAAILLAPLYPRGAVGEDRNAVAADTANCARHARDLFSKLTGESWD